MLTPQPVQRRPKAPKALVPPVCPSCKVDARKTTGKEIYPYRPDLAAKVFWRCDGCGGYVGSHPDGKPMGTPADLKLRQARGHVHDKLDPIWKSAVETGGYVAEDDLAGHKIRACAKGRVYTYLAHHLGITRKECHVAMFDIETCRRAWHILKGKTYPEIRDWYKETHPKKDAA